MGHCRRKYWVRKMAFDLHAVEKYLKDHNIEYEGCFAYDDTLCFKWISSQITFEELAKFEEEFNVTLGHNGVEDGKIKEPDFYKVE